MATVMVSQEGSRLKLRSRSHSNPSPLSLGSIAEVPESESACSSPLKQLVFDISLPSPSDSSSSSSASSPSVHGVRVQSGNSSTARRWRSSTWPQAKYGHYRKKELAKRRVMDEDCGICFELAVLPIRTRCCLQLFCATHLSDWLESAGSDGRCPTCRVRCSISENTVSLVSPSTSSSPRKSPSPPPHLHLSESHLSPRMPTSLKSTVPRAPPPSPTLASMSHTTAPIDVRRTFVTPKANTKNANENRLPPLILLLFSLIPSYIGRRTLLPPTLAFCTPRVKLDPKILASVWNGEVAKKLLHFTFVAIVLFVLLSQS
ncbi:hypothetical protein JAAARDRAFT_42272 [Jaapia argillacea MUCL 33604]|uniref:RING-type domain-containing protein n=1 Tax=Jaapia argillacea MUCL 33604 TaxID=933084 RepID=A0A067PGY5_9AGAM|nr:hypothetical protein JAAARDRAFT_42272 [Jaapia argillacea MUCL 33604]